ncbi:hypothetical protein MTR67_003785 [Solanum verrucosum]|uniref:Uncharacterized protein n=1 Tax=Solanum verrucosum TaxID=315347 RepID=A0AAF0PUZ1_SOLVR|nr:hypothetical protein MTR67_003785 [Solanum verrucosum]
MAFHWSSLFKFTFLLLLLAAIATACFTLPVEKILKDFLQWIEQDLGPWGPLVLGIPQVGYGEVRVYEDHTLPRGVKETVFG